MKETTRTHYQQIVLRAAATIVGGLDDALDLKALARRAALAPLHFHRVFRGVLGETPLELHRRLRLERAAHQLVSTDAQVTRIAFDAGYETHESFTRAFRDAFQESPSELRLRAVAAREAGTRLPQVTLAARCGVHFTASDAVPTFHLSPEHTPMNVTIDTMPALRVAAVSHQGPYNQISEAFGRLDALVRSANLDHHAEGMVAIYHDDPDTTDASELRSEAGLIVRDAVVLPSGLTEITLPPGRYARTVHVGPYEQLGDAWARLMGAWLPQSGERIGAADTYERYYNTPMDTPPDQLRTELFLPLA